MSDRTAVISIMVLLFGAVAAVTLAAGCGASDSADAAAGVDAGQAAEDTGATDDSGASLDAGEPDVGTPADAGDADTGSPAHACIKGGSAVAATAVTVKNFSFDPPCITVARGTKVTWTNAGMASHTVTSDSGGVATFDSGALGAAGTFELTFDAAGWVDYFCIPHEAGGMKGTVIVE